MANSVDNSKRLLRSDPPTAVAVEDVLLHFGETVKVARRRYREFVEKGIAQGTRPDLQGGGLVRSAGGEKVLAKKYLRKRPIQELIEFVAAHTGIPPELICSGSRKPMISGARSIVAYMAIEETGHAATDVARYLGIRQTSVLQSVRKGRILSAGIGSASINY